VRAADRLALRALVVCDEPRELARTRALLDAVASYRCDVRVAATGADAEAALRARDLDVVVLDVAAGADAALALLRAASGAAPPPVVLITDVDDPAADERASAAGVGALVERAGLTATRLDRGIRSALARHRAAFDARGAGLYFRAGFDALQEHVAILDATA
jgi:AmiR/NasT family two-component response regulator